MKIAKLSSLAVPALVLISCATATAPGPVAPARDPNALSPLAQSPRRIPEPKIRVGLLTDEARAELPRINGGWVIVGEAGPHTLRRGFTAIAPRAGAPVRWTVRVATFDTAAAAEQEAERVRGMTSVPVEVVQDAAGKWRVLAGDFESSEAGDPVREEILRRGYRPPLYVIRRASAEPFARRLVLEDDEGSRYTIEGDSILVLPAEGETLRIAGQPYRGGARLRINDRGLLNVINEVGLEDYLRGVVPGELGPRTYDELEAQKAQAIAARTYAVRRLGEFAAEGYDICPTAACQVYRGFSIEEELSNQAIDATAGMVMVHDGRPIDALYTSTCGGETSDVSTMFPGRDDPYLKRARCVELEVMRLRGRRDGEVVSETEASAAIFAAIAGLPARSGSLAGAEVVAAVEAANRIIGWTPPAPAAPPPTARRADVLDYLGRTWGLSAIGRELTLPEDRAYFFGEQRANDATAAVQAFLVKYGIVPAQAATGAELDGPMPRTELHALLLSWLGELGAIGDVEARISALDASRMELKLASGNRTFPIPPEPLPLFRRFRERHREESSVPVMVSDRARVIHDRAGTPLAIVVEANYDGASFDRTSGFANWTRSYRADQIVASMAGRVPIRELRGLRPLAEDASHRVTRMEVTAEEGRTFVLEGIQIRFSLELPDNLFEMIRTKDADGVDRYTFFGKGWGHGTGMCQIGAYGMAFRGWDVERILKNFYSGIEIERFD
ncbi:MAG TPA: SpoIID/LytB domain-containing protein [Thermoanaerobaculia bacterium]|nr:SpoIID/LytB domain-containing protein [Thermoanaerobaculia bacterium]